MEIYKSRTDETLASWQWLEPSLRNITHLILKWSPNGGGRALDVGCGTGRVSFALAEQGYDVTGVDVEERVIKIAKQIGNGRTRKPDFRVVDFRLRSDASGPENSWVGTYDLVVCSEVLEHIEDYHPVIDNLYLALRPGGRAIITVPYDPRKWSVLDKYAGHVRRYTYPQILQDLSRFSTVHIEVTGFPFYRLLVRAYLAKIKLFGQQHSNEALWESRTTRWIANALYPFMRLDNIFVFTRLGDALIAVADKSTFEPSKPKQTAAGRADDS